MSCLIYINVIVSGNANQLLEFEEKHFKKEKFEKVIFDFNTIAPTPDWLKSEEGQKRDWREKNWGSYRNSFDLDFGDAEENCIKFSFCLFAASPELIFEKLASIYPDLRFKISIEDESLNLYVSGEIFGDFNSMTKKSDFATHLHESWS